MPLKIHQQNIDYAYGVDLEIQDKPMRYPQDHYVWYRLTPLQFKISSFGNYKDVKVDFHYVNRLTPTEARYATLFWYHQDLEEWQIINTVHHESQKKLSGTMPSSNGVVAVALNDYWYSKYTQRMADEFPIWTKIRQSKDSNGQRILNFIGMELEKLDDHLRAIQKEKYIDSADVDQLDWVFVYETPQLNRTDTIRVYHQDKEVPVLETLEEFFYNKTEGGIIFDFDEQKAYSLKHISEIQLVIERWNETYTFNLKGIPHHIWNTFDEFGMLVGVRRLHLEPNASFKERIKDVFRYPANSSNLGLTHGIARELNMIQRVTWHDDTKDLYLKGKGIDPRTLRMDGEPLAPDQYEVKENGHIVIKRQNTGMKRTVSFIKGIYKHELYNHQDETLYQLKYEEDGQATARFRQWVDYINQVAPVMWGRFKWDEGYWDTIDHNLTGLGYLPNIWDSNIEIWKNYTFTPKQEGNHIWQS